MAGLKDRLAALLGRRGTLAARVILCGVLLGLIYRLYETPVETFRYWGL